MNAKQRFSKYFSFASSEADEEVVQKFDEGYKFIKSQVEKKFIIELGAGVGVAGIVASLAGARHVTVTDLPYCLDNIRKNAVLNEIDLLEEEYHSDDEFKEESSVGSGDKNIESEYEKNDKDEYYPKKQKSSDKKALTVAELDWFKPEQFLDKIHHKGKYADDYAEEDENAVRTSVAKATKNNEVEENPYSHKAAKISTNEISSSEESDSDADAILGDLSAKAQKLKAKAEQRDLKAKQQDSLKQMNEAKNQQKQQDDYQTNTLIAGYEKREHDNGRLFDTIIAADVLWLKHLAEPLAHTVEVLMKDGEFHMRMKVDRITAAENLEKTKQKAVDDFHNKGYATGLESKRHHHDIGNAHIPTDGKNTRVQKTDIKAHFEPMRFIMAHQTRSRQLDEEFLDQLKSRNILIERVYCVHKQPEINVFVFVYEHD